MCVIHLGRRALMDWKSLGRVFPSKQSASHEKDLYQHLQKHLLEIPDTGRQCKTICHGFYLDKPPKPHVLIGEALDHGYVILD